MILNDCMVSVEPRVTKKSTTLKYELHYDDKYPYLNFK